MSSTPWLSEDAVTNAGGTPWSLREVKHPRRREGLFETRRHCFFVFGSGRGLLWYGEHRDLPAYLTLRSTSLLVAPAHSPRVGRLTGSASRPPTPAPSLVPYDTAFRVHREAVTENVRGDVQSKEEAV